MGASKTNLRDHASWLYINHRLSLTEISSKIDVPIKTLSAWKKGKQGELDWDARRNIIVSSPSAIKEVLMNEMLNVSRGEKTKVDADTLVKLSASMNRIDKQMSVQIITNAIMQYESFLAQDSPEEAVRCLPFHKKFILHLINSDNS